jgi:hypothetical protein
MAGRSVAFPAILYLIGNYEKNKHSRIQPAPTANPCPTGNSSVITCLYALLDYESPRKALVLLAYFGGGALAILSSYMVAF